MKRLDAFWGWNMQPQLEQIIKLLTQCAIAGVAPRTYLLNMSITTGDIVVLRLNPKGPRWVVQDTKDGQLLLKLLSGRGQAETLIFGWDKQSQYMKHA